MECDMCNGTGDCASCLGSVTTETRRIDPWPMALEPDMIVVESASGHLMWMPRATFDAYYDGFGYAEYNTIDVAPDESAVALRAGASGELGKGSVGV